MRQGQSSRRMCSGTTPPWVHFKWPRSGPASWSWFDTVLHELRDENLQLPACSSRVGDGSGSRCSCGVSFSAPAVSWGPPPIAGVYNAGCRHSVVRDGRTSPHPARVAATSVHPHRQWSQDLSPPRTAAGSHAGYLCRECRAEVWRVVVEPGVASKRYSVPRRVLLASAADEPSPSWPTTFCQTPTVL